MTKLHELNERAVVSSSDEAAWLAARRQGITATEVAKIANGREWNTLLAEKRNGERTFFGNQYTQHGKDREPVIAEWVFLKSAISHNETLFHAEGNKRHLATPDGVGLIDGELFTSEIKTSKYSLHPTGSHFASSGYYDQMQWAMYVTGATNCCFVWEQHDDFWPNPTPFEVEQAWIARDPARIAELVDVADKFLAELDESPVDPARFEGLIADYLVYKDEADRFKLAMEVAAEEIRQLIGEREHFTIETAYGKATLSTPKPRETFDAATFKEVNPDVYAAFLKTSEAKPSLRVTAPKAGA